MTDKITTIKPRGPAIGILTNCSTGVHPAPRQFFKNVEDMTEDEKADEIIRRLSQPYKTLAERLEDHMLAVLSAEIAKEIDSAVIRQI